MGLLAALTGANMIVESALQVRYSGTCNRQAFSFEDDGEAASYERNIWEFHRYATGAWKWVGLSKEAALNGQKIKVAQYTRRKRVSTIVRQNGAPVMDRVNTIECTANIVARQTSGSMWELSLSVNEDDVAYTFSPPQDPSGLFGYENARYYEESSYVVDGGGQTNRIGAFSCEPITYADGVLSYTVPDRLPFGGPANGEGMFVVSWDGWMIDGDQVAVDEGVTGQVEAQLVPGVSYMFVYTPSDGSPGDAGWADFMCSEPFVVG